MRVGLGQDLSEYFIDLFAKPPATPGYGQQVAVAQAEWQLKQGVADFEVRQKESDKQVTYWIYGAAIFVGVLFTMKALRG